MSIIGSLVGHLTGYTSFKQDMNVVLAELTFRSASESNKRQIIQSAITILARVERLRTNKDAFARLNSLSRYAQLSYVAMGCGEVGIRPIVTPWQWEPVRNPYSSRNSADEASLGDTVRSFERRNGISVNWPGSHVRHDFSPYFFDATAPSGTPVAAVERPRHNSSITLNDIMEAVELPATSRVEERGGQRDAKNDTWRIRDDALEQVKRERSKIKAIKRNELVESLFDSARFACHQIRTKLLGIGFRDSDLKGSGTDNSFSGAGLMGLCLTVLSRASDDVAVSLGRSREEFSVSPPEGPTSELLSYARAFDANGPKVVEAYSVFQKIILVGQNESERSESIVSCLVQLCGRWDECYSVKAGTPPGYREEWLKTFLADEEILRAAYAKMKARIQELSRTSQDFRFELLGNFVEPETAEDISLEGFESSGNLALDVSIRRVITMYKRAGEILRAAGYQPSMLTFQQEHKSYSVDVLSGMCAVVGLEPLRRKARQRGRGPGFYGSARYVEILDAESKMFEGAGDTVGQYVVLSRLYENTRTLQSIEEFILVCIYVACSRQKFSDDLTFQSVSAVSRPDLPHAAKKVADEILAQYVRLLSDIERVALRDPGCMRALGC